MAKEVVISLIAAIGKNREIGKGNKLLWSLPSDLKRFKELTRGRPVVMGRKTFDSIVEVRGKPLESGRTSIVLTRDKNWSHKGAIAAHSIEDALERAKECGEYIFVIGGEQVYRESLPFADELQLTLVNATAEADAFFPAYEDRFRPQNSSDVRSENGTEFRWVGFKKH